MFGGAITAAWRLTGKTALRSMLCAIPGKIREDLPAEKKFHMVCLTPEPRL